ncbi:MAG: hypothetical protein NC541_03475 [bacterium]|nr:hypothetical protein [bacterium]
MQILISGVLKKGDRRFARVSFLRGKDYAEFTVPDGMMDGYRGFSEEEITKLCRYVRENRDQILQEAKGVNPMKNWLGV